MNSLIIIGCLILLVVWLTYKIGTIKIKLDQAEKAISTYEKYQKIDATPDVDNPFEQLR